MKYEYEPISENELSEGLRHIRSFYLAQGLYVFMETGLHRYLRERSRATARQIAADLSFDERRLTGFLQYLANEAFVYISNGAVSLTASGVNLSKFYPWYSLLVGGYAETLLELGTTLRSSATYAPRNGQSVGIGSCGISQHDALPMTRLLLSLIRERLGTVIDVGCGDGSYLIELCGSLPGLNGIGIEPEFDSILAARRSAKAAGLDNRLTFVSGSAQEMPSLARVPVGAVCFIVAFVLQEVLEQSGRDEVVRILRKLIGQQSRHSYCVVIEVDHRPDDETVMSSGLGLGYYNPYYLLHQITEQRLESVSFWLELFADAGCDVISSCKPDPAYDSLGLKVGFLLAPQSSVSGDIP
jgi:2-ketoarginine methyltransferase